MTRAPSIPSTGLRYVSGCRFVPTERTYSIEIDKFKDLYLHLLLKYFYYVLCVHFTFVPGEINPLEIFFLILPRVYTFRI